MAKKGGTETVRQSLDPQSQAYVNRLRMAAQGGYDAVQNAGPLIAGPDGRPIGEQIAPYFNAFTEGVIDPTRAEFDYLRAQATRGANDAAIRAGAFNGGRHGVAEGVRLGALDRAQATTIADLQQQGYNNALSVGLPHIEQQRQLRERLMQEPIFRSMQGLNLLNLGLGPTGSVSEHQKETGWGPQVLGGLLSLASFFPPTAPVAAPLAAANAGGFQLPGTSGAGGLFGGQLPGRY